MFAELYAKARNGEIASAVAFHAPTSANPRVDKTYLEEQEAVLGHDDFRREFGAEFIAGGASFIENSAIRECVADWREALPADGRDWVLAFDAAFASDPSADRRGGAFTDRSHAPDLRAHAALAAPEIAPQGPPLARRGHRADRGGHRRRRIDRDHLPGAGRRRPAPARDGHRTSSRSTGSTRACGRGRRSHGRRRRRPCGRGS